MSEPFRDDWVSALQSAGRAADVRATGEPVVIQQVITEADGSETAYVVQVDGDGMVVRPGRGADVDVDVTFTQDRATAEAVHRGELSAQVAFMTGRLRVGGDLARLTADARHLAGLADRFDGLGEV